MALLCRSFAVHARKVCSIVSLLAYFDRHRDMAEPETPLYANRGALPPSSTPFTAPWTSKLLRGRLACDCELPSPVPDQFDLSCCLLEWVSRRGLEQWLVKQNATKPFRALNLLSFFVIV